jgi:hypothetical protein
MAAGTFTVYGAAVEAIAKNPIDLDTGTFVLTLHTSSYTPTVNTDDTWSDVSTTEFTTANGYTAGGKVLTMSVTRSGATVTVDADDQSWTSSTLTSVKYGIVTQRAGGSLVAGDLLLGYFELESGGTVSTTNGTLAVNWNASGLFTIART